jgi:DNA-binding protein H-NS
MAKEYASMSIADLSALVDELTSLLNDKKEARRQELLAELETLRPTGKPKPVKAASAPTSEVSKRTPPKPAYRAPDGFEWSGRGAMPKAFKALGVTDKKQLEQYRIVE